MASKSLGLWRSLASARRFATSTVPKMRHFAPTADVLVAHRALPKSKTNWGEFTPVYVSLGLILMSVSFGIHTANQQLRHAPNVLVSKKKRETVPEVVDPDWAAAEAERFLGGFVFRRVVHLQDFNAVRSGIDDPARGNTIGMPKKVETLKSVGIDPVELR